MKEPPIQATSLQLAHRAGITVGKNRLRTIRRSRDLGEAPGDGIDRLVPTDSGESATAFGPDALHRPTQSVRVINAVQMARHLLAQEATRKRMVGIAAQLDRTTVFHGNHHPTRVRTIVGTDGPNSPSSAGVHTWSCAPMVTRSYQVRW